MADGDPKETMTAPELDPNYPKEGVGATRAKPATTTLPSNQGRYDPKGDISRTSQDIETERLSRIADYLNNYIGMSGTVLPGGDLMKGAMSQGGKIDKPEIKTEDTELQKLRRNYENARRTWEGGLTQQTKMFDQNMELLSRTRKAITDLWNNLRTALLTSETVDTRTRRYLEDLNGLIHDERSIVNVLLDYLVNENVDSGMRQPGSTGEPYGSTQPKMPDVLQPDYSKLLDMLKGAKGAD